ncbi:unnamed protein product [Adineta steineri]|uniref:ADP ribosyltransferase domain-containing protein n=1 Tax=Adineta steineri TaxID=433720 RepID=A0A818SR07_9BILA|nr:unnamed protein product [Adineta steineri]CAF3671282.1 unnamed protein product [Adineta steineri]
MPKTQRLRPMHFTLIWFNSKDLDDLIICQLLSMFKVIFPVNKLDQCLELLRLIHNEKVILIVPNEVLESIGASIQPMSHVDSVYIYSEEQINLEQWKLANSKLKGSFSDLLSQCRLSQRVWHPCHLAPISSNVLPSNAEFMDRASNQLDPTYMWTQLLKEVILEIDNDSEALQKMFNYFRQKFENDCVMLDTIIKTEKEYRSKTAITWYTAEIFFYSVLNTALRLQDVEIILQFGPYLRDLHEQIKQLHAIQYPASSFKPFTVYRCQRMGKAEFDKLRTNRGGLYSFNNFLSTSLDLDVASIIADSIAMSTDQNLLAIQFVINIRHSQNDVPFADVSEISQHDDEQEILFSMHTIFRVTDIEPIGNNYRIWRFVLESTDDNDDKLQMFAEKFRSRVGILTTQYRIAHILVALSYKDQALKIYQELLQSTNDQDEQALLHFHIGDIKYIQHQYQEAIKEFEQAISIYNKMTRDGKEGRFFTSNGAVEAYSTLGSIYGDLNEYNQAVYYLRKALQINPLIIKNWYTLASLLRKEGLYLYALEVSKTISGIQAKNTPEGHPNWIRTYDLIGAAHMDLDQNEEALVCFMKSLHIAQNFFSSDHPYFSSCYRTIAETYANMGNYEDANTYYHMALKIYEKLPGDEASLANFYTALVQFYIKYERYETALKYFEKSLEIKKRILPVDHIDFAMMDLNQAVLYYRWKKYDKAESLFLITFYKFRSNFSGDRSCLAECCAHMGKMWHELGRDDEALSFYKNALEIRQVTPFSNYQQLAALYVGIAAVYHETNDYGEALAYYERAKSTRQQVLSNNHPIVQELNEKLEETEFLMHTNFY